MRSLVWIFAVRIRSKVPFRSRRPIYLSLLITSDDNFNPKWLLYIWWLLRANNGCWEPTRTQRLKNVHNLTYAHYSLLFTKQIVYTFFLHKSWTEETTQLSSSPLTFFFFFFFFFCCFLWSVLHVGQYLSGFVCSFCFPWSTVCIEKQHFTPFNPCPVPEEGSVPWL